jgi:hypothetical protein
MLCRVWGVGQKNFDQKKLPHTALANVKSAIAALVEIVEAGGGTVAFQASL